MDMLQLPENEKRPHRIVKLDNGLHVVLVSDEKTEMAAAAVTSKVGYFSDTLPGLAHALEHFIFLGTEQYPDESGFNTFLSMNGGSTNAFTDAEETVYYFNVQASQLHEGFRRFASFFTNPLFDEKCVEREVRAVDSEHAKNIPSDGWRFHHLAKHTANPSSVFHNFGTGNLKTLLPDSRTETLGALRSKVIEFFDREYSASTMSVAVLGRESLDELEAMVRKQLDGVRNNNRTIPVFDNPPPLTPDEFATIVYAVPNQKQHSLDISWAIPSQNELWRTKPARYIAHLLGHEGEGSLFSVLKQNNLADELIAGVGFSTTGFAIFGVTIHIPEEAVPHWQHIVRMVFEYIELIKRSGISLEIFNECRDIAAAGFRFKEQSKPMSYVQELARQVLNYPAEKLLAGAQLWYDFDPEQIRSTINGLVPDKARIMIKSPRFENDPNIKLDQTEPHYGIKYALQRFTDAQIRLWTINGDTSSATTTAAGAAPMEIQGTLHIPKPNILIATDFTLRELPDNVLSSLDTPVLLRNTAGQRIWWLPDKRFKQPRAIVRCKLLSPVSYSSPRNAVLTKLLNEILNDALKEYSYDASVAGLHYTLSHTSEGFVVEFRGYSHKLLTLMERVAETIGGASINRDRFETIRQLLAMSLHNSLIVQASEFAWYELSLLLEYSRWHVEDYLAVISEITVSELEEFAKRVFREGFLETFVHGNLDIAEAERVGDIFAKHLRFAALMPSQMPDTNRVIAIPEGDDLLYSAKLLDNSNDNNAVLMYYEVGVPLSRKPEDLYLDVLCDIASQYLGTSFYDSLRTVQQLGYVVYSQKKITHQSVLGLIFMVQSNTFTVEDVLSRIETFISTELRTMILGPEPEAEGEGDKSSPDLCSPHLYDHMGSLAKQALKEQHKKSMGFANYASVQASLIRMYLEPEKNLAALNSKFGSEIFSHKYNFARRKHMAELVQTITYEDVVWFFSKYVWGPARKRLTMLVHGNKSDANVSDRPSLSSGRTLIADRYAFKRTAALHPLIESKKPLSSFNLV